MLDFEYFIPTKMIFGRNKVDKLGEEIKKYANRILIVYGSDNIKRIRLYDKIIQILKESKIEYEELPGIRSNPTITNVRHGVAICKQSKLRFVLAVGGGSVIDCAKSITAGAKYEGDPWDFFRRKSAVNNVLPLGTVLTVAGAGSEMNGIAIIKNEGQREKRQIESDLLRPKFSILDPTYTFTVPKSQTAAGIVDTFCHIIEQYFSSKESTFLQDRMAESLLKTCIKYSSIVMKDRRNYEARANLIWTSSLALNGILRCGKTRDLSPHIIESALSAVHNRTHADGLAIIVPNWMEYVLNEETLSRFVEYSKNVWEIKGKSDYEIAKKGIENTKQFFKELGMPENLVEILIYDNRDLEKIAEKATMYGHLGCLKTLTKEDVLEILKKARGTNFSSDLQIIEQLEEEMNIRMEEYDEDIHTGHNTAYRKDINRNVIGLYLDFADLEELPRLVLRLRNLQELSLRKNRLTRIPAEISELVSLNKLYLNNNVLAGIPPEIGRLENLTELDLSYNNITSLPEEIIKLKKLLKLNIQGNPLKRPPLEIAEKNIRSIFDYFCKSQNTLEVNSWFGCTHGSDLD